MRSRDPYAGGRRRAGVPDRGGSPVFELNRRQRGTPPVSDRPALAAVGVGRAGVYPTWVRAASVDRLVWRQTSQPPKPDLLPGGHVEPRPVAVGRFSRMHRAAARDGASRLVRRAAPGLIPGYSAAHQLLLGLPGGAGFDIPAVTEVTHQELWMTRPAWAQRTSPSSGAIDAYVVSLLEAALGQGAIIATGQPHVLAGGGIVCEDVLLAHQLEPDERALLVELVSSLVRDEPVGVADTVRALCHTPIPEVTDTAQRACLSLRVRWTPSAFGVALSQIARCAVRAGPRSEPLVLLADELLHRLDLAHEHHCHPQNLRSPECVDRLLAPASHLT